MNYTKQLTFEEGIRLIHQYCKGRKHKCISCPMCIIPDGCWFTHYPSGWRIESFAEKCNETLEWIKELGVQDEVD